MNQNVITPRAEQPAGESVAAGHVPFDFEQIDIFVTSTVQDHLNTNVAIRSNLFQAFQSMFGPNRVRCEPLELAPLGIRRYRPKLVIAVGSLAIDATDLIRLKRAAEQAHSLIALWLHDDPYEFDYSFKADIADFVFSNDSWAVQHYEHPSVHHLPLAGFPAVHQRTICPVRARDIGAFFCGVAYQNRVDLFRSIKSVLSEYPTEVFGAEWPPDFSFARNERLSAAEVSDFAQRSRLTLNVGRDFDLANDRFGLPSSTPGPRTFEIALAGSAQLFFATSLEIADYFEPGSEIILVDGVRDVRIAMERAYDAPDEIERIAVSAQKRAMAEHTYKSRAETITRICIPELSGVEGRGS